MTAVVSGVRESPYRSQIDGLPTMTPSEKKIASSLLCSLSSGGLLGFCSHDILVTFRIYIFMPHRWFVRERQRIFL